jgi:hypothetical protein
MPFDPAKMRNQPPLRKTAVATAPLRHGLAAALGVKNGA